MVRQYIGARYVTKIYENSQNPSSADWEGGVTYEPLTLVTYNNGSYLSKKDVPGTVGDPASNPVYWVQTGFYNGQIASLQSQIDTINAFLNDNGQETLDTTAQHIVGAINELNAGVPANSYAYYDRVEFSYTLDNETTFFDFLNNANTHAVNWINTNYPESNWAFKFAQIFYQGGMNLQENVKPAPYHNSEFSGSVTKAQSDGAYTYALSFNPNTNVARFRGYAITDSSNVTMFKNFEASTDISSESAGFKTIYFIFDLYKKIK